MIMVREYGASSFTELLGGLPQVKSELVTSHWVDHFSPNWTGDQRLGSELKVRDIVQDWGCPNKKMMYFLSAFDKNLVNSLKYYVKLELQQRSTTLVR